jgi:MYXO-CTERM domain-containing protein
MKLTPAEGLSSSTAVFSGEVTEIEKNESTRFGGLEVTLRVNEVWKGAAAEEIRVHTAGSSAACGYPFVVGTTYLVFAYNDEADPIRVSLCSRTAPIEDAKEDIEFLGKPSHRFDSGARAKSKESKGGCNAASGSTDDSGAAWIAVMLAGAALQLRRRRHSKD